MLLILIVLEPSDATADYTPTAIYLLVHSGGLFDNPGGINFDLSVYILLCVRLCSG